MDIKTYYEVRIHYISGGEGQFIFLDKASAQRCLDGYRQWAASVAAELEKRVPEDRKSHESIELELTPDVTFRWNGPLGFIYFRAAIRELASCDHLHRAEKDK